MTTKCKSSYHQLNHLLAEIAYNRLQYHQLLFLTTNKSVFKLYFTSKQCKNLRLFSASIRATSARRLASAKTQRPRPLDVLLQRLALPLIGQLVAQFQFAQFQLFQHQEFLKKKHSTRKVANLIRKIPDFQKNRPTWSLPLYPISLSIILSISVTQNKFLDQKQLLFLALNCNNFLQVTSRNLYRETVPETISMLQNF